MPPKKTPTEPPKRQKRPHSTLPAKKPKQPHVPKCPDRVPHPTPDGIKMAGKRGVQATKKVLDMKESMRLRLSGFSYREIAEVTKRTKSEVHRFVQEALREAREETRECAEAMLQIENDRLDMIQAVNWGDAMRKDPICTAHVFKAIEMRVRLNGLAAPTKIETTSPGYAIDKLNLDIETRKKILEAMEKAESV